jgi:hypothetical protein
VLFDTDAILIKGINGIVVAVCEAARAYFQDIPPGCDLVNPTVSAALDQCSRSLCPSCDYRSGSWEPCSLRLGLAPVVSARWEVFMGVLLCPHHIMMSYFISRQCKINHSLKVTGK